MNNSIIQIVSTIKGLELLKEIKPAESNKFIPSWWKEIPTIKGYVTAKETVSGNVKTCPSFPDYFSNGIVIPMWTDVLFSFDSETEQWAWKTPSSEFTWDIHPHDQFLNHVPFKFFNKNGKFIFKANCPWKIITPPGYSVLQLPVFYHYTNDFTILPGVVDTDIHHTINQQVLYLSDKTEFIIKRGTPFVQYIPFKREQFNAEVRYQTESDEEKFRVIDLRIGSKFDGDARYIKYRKNIEEYENE